MRDCKEQKLGPQGADHTHDQQPDNKPVPVRVISTTHADLVVVQSDGRRFERVETVGSFALADVDKVVEANPSRRDNIVSGIVGPMAEDGQFGIDETIIDINRPLPAWL